jgi:hypothetical protein
MSAEFEREVAARLAAVRERVAAAARRAGRAPDSVTIVGVAKGQPAARVVAAVAASLRDVGESFAQEAKAKLPLVRAELERRGVGPPRFHFVGRLQTNKARLAAELFGCVHSLDRPELARELARRAEAAGRRLRALVQANLSGEPQKGGVAPERLGELLALCRGLPALEVVGLMTVPEAEDDPERARARFAELRALRDTHAREAPGLRELSMGMSADYEVAIEEGATMVRIGTALFGARTAA